MKPALWRLFRRMEAALFLLVAGMAPAQTSVAPRYVPHPVFVFGGAGYVRPDGSVLIAGSHSMRDVLMKWDSLFEKAHPGIHFKLLLKGSSTGIGALTAGVSALAPMSRHAWESDLRPFRFVYGYPASEVIIGRSGYAGPGRTNPPAIYVQRDNPLAGLTVEQAAQIFTAGSPAGDIRQWDQVGLTGEWAGRRIHVYGPRDNGGFATSTRTTRMSSRPFANSYEPLPDYGRVIDAVSHDRYGIGLAGSFESTQVPANVRMLPLAANAGGPFSSASYEDVRNDLYPYSPSLRIYFNRAPGKPIDPLVKEYLRLVLSREGQAVLLDEKGKSSGLVPLSDREANRQRSKLD